MNFEDYLLQTEAKQVGVVYHFTTLDSLFKMMNPEYSKSKGREPFEFVSNNNLISCTRDHCLSTSNKSDEISHKKGYIVRITLDGDRLSNKFKIKPIKGLDDYSDPFDRNNKNRTTSDENEEVVVSSSKYKFLPYIKQIDILKPTDKLDEQFLPIVVSYIRNNYDFPIGIVSKFTNLGGIMTFESYLNEAFGESETSYGLNDEYDNREFRTLDSKGSLETFVKNNDDTYKIQFKNLEPHIFEFSFGLVDGKKLLYTAINQGLNAISLFNKMLYVLFQMSNKSKEVDTIVFQPGSQDHLKLYNYLASNSAVKSFLKTKGYNPIIKDVNMFYTTKLGAGEPVFSRKLMSKGLVRKIADNL